uniref:DNA topoisomerase n=1 Tax=Sinocyclocheilus grahami TaxID=75366 RepID=A0A672QFA9_SINGR
MRTVFMVAEKPSLAQSIAKILSKGSCSSRKGLNGACSVHEYTGSFMGQNVRFKMTSVCGHVMSLDFIGKYFVEAKGCDYVVLWLDCDKEGENICFEVLDAIQPLMNMSYGNDCTVYRAKFSSITDTDICNAMNRLGEPNRNEALSVDARQELDLRIGCAFTRFQTKYFQGKYGNLDSSLISFGPCQTPTLGFCVERHDKIQSFKPEAYWVIQAKVSSGKDSPLTLDWDRVRVFDRDVGQMFVNMAKTAKEAKVESVSKKEKAKQRPIALNTVEMLRVASSALGMGPQHTMQIAERLYTQGYISYPRTETTHYPENFDLKGTLKQQANSSFWGETVKALLSEGINRPKKGVDVGDHPPITPMRAASENELGIFTFTCLILKCTDASIPVHINNICQRNYVTVESGRKLKPTNLGIVLVHGYYKIDADLVLPTIRSAVEKQLNLIALGKANFHQVLQHTLDIFKRKFHYFVDSIAGMDELMEVSFSPIAATGKPLSRCGKCHRFMKYIQAKPSRLHCSHCDETYSLPQNGAIKLYKELKCPLDEFELVLWTSGSRGKSYPVCPYCFSNPPFRDMKKGMGCNECTHPSCQHSLNSLGIGQCVECETGVLVFDPTSGPKWRMACNKCNVVVHFFEHAHKVQVSQDSCDSCEASLVIVDFNKTRSPLPDGETQHTGCVFCDPVFQDLVELKHATMRHPMHRAGGARRGRGRGRGRRPVGRGNPKKPKDKMAALAAYFV